MSPKVQHRRKTVRTEDEAQTWLDKLPKKAHREGIVERADGPGGIVLSASWESRSFDPSLYVMNEWLESILPPSDIPAREMVRVEDLEPGDLVVNAPNGVLDDARLVTDVDEDGVTLDNGSRLPRYRLMHYPSPGRRRDQWYVGRFPERLKAKAPRVQAA